MPAARAEELMSGMAAALCTLLRLTMAAGSWVAAADAGVGGDAVAGWPWCLAGRSDRGATSAMGEASAVLVATVMPALTAAFADVALIAGQ